MSSIEGVESLLGTGALAQAGWLLLRATQSLEDDQRCAVVELVPSQFHVKSALGVLAPIFIARRGEDANAGMTRGPNSFLFASKEREVGVLARNDRITFVVVAPVSSAAAEADFTAAVACEYVDRLLREATKLMDKIAIASSEDIDPSRLPASWNRRRLKPVRVESDDDDDGECEETERPLPPMTRKEWNQQLDAIAEAIGSDPAEFRAGVKAQIRARENDARTQEKSVDSKNRE